MKKTFSTLFCLGLFGTLMTPAANAQSWLDEGVREFEELRLQQLQTVQNGTDMSPFTTDGCSGGQSQNWELLAKTLPGFEKQFGGQPPWEDCCVAHDKVYWRGITEGGYDHRKHADEELKQCVITTGQTLAPELSRKYSVSEQKIRQAFSVTAELMYKAVRLGGQPCSLLPWRWGYGWPNCAFVTTSNVAIKHTSLNPNEHITFFNTSGWLDTDGMHWHIPIHAWIYEPQDSIARIGLFAALLESTYDLKVTANNEANYRQRSNLIIADNEEDKTVVIRIAGQDLSLPASGENGHVYAELKLPTEVVNAYADQGRLHYFAVTAPDDQRRFEGDVQLVPPQGVSIISDIDDTIKITNVRDHKKLFDNTFFENYQEVLGMPSLYQQLVEHNATIHYVSSSPWQLYDPLQVFLHKTGFPWATMDLKSVRLTDKTLLNLFKNGAETKPKQIEPILQRYPLRQFILIGDSGEQDPEAYSDIARRYPAQIHKILIRNVDNSHPEDMRYKKAFEKIAKSKWQLFADPKGLSADELVNIK